MIVDRESKGTEDDPYTFPYVEFEDNVDALMREIHSFADLHPEFGLYDYHEILDEIRREQDTHVMSDIDVSNLDGRAVTALILGAVRAERFNTGALLAHCEDGSMARWLRRLKEIDDSQA